MTFRSAAIFFWALTQCLAMANAAEFESVYTDLDLDDCLILSTEAEVDENLGAEWVCAGHDRIVVWVAEGDLRYFLGYGSRGRDQCSYTQTIGPFHTVHDTLEWRLRRDGGQTTPIATILRYFADSDGQKRQFLVVTKLDGETACHMAVVEASQPNANQLARDAADRFGSGFRCGTEKAFYYSAQGVTLEGELGIGACPH